MSSATAIKYDGSPEGWRTNDTFRFTHTSEANATVELFEGITSEGTATADSSGNWSIDLSGVSDGSHAYKAKATGEAGNTSAQSEARTLRVDTAKPSGAVLINNGAASTASRTVTLKLNATDPAPASGVTWSGWEAYARSKSWKLTRGAGTKTVFVQYRDLAGNISVKAKDSITYRP